MLKLAGVNDDEAGETTSSGSNEGVQPNQTESSSSNAPLNAYLTYVTLPLLTIMNGMVTPFLLLLLSLVYKLFFIYFLFNIKQNRSFERTIELTVDQNVAQ